MTMIPKVMIFANKLQLFAIPLCLVCEPKLVIHSQQESLEESCICTNLI